MGDMTKILNHDVTTFFSW